MTYAEFIAEIECLVGRGDAITGADADHESRPFRDWRYAVETTVTNAKEQGFKVPGEFDSENRHYMALWDAPRGEHRKVFTRDMADSLTELRFIVEQYRKFGDPTPRRPGDAAPATAPALARPDRVTVRWLIDYVSAMSWLAVAGLALALFFLGYGAGKFEFFSKLLALIKGVQDASPH